MSTAKTLLLLLFFILMWGIGGMFDAEDEINYHKAWHECADVNK